MELPAVVASGPADGLMTDEEEARHSDLGKNHVEM